MTPAESAERARLYREWKKAEIAVRQCQGALAAANQRAFETAYDVAAFDAAHKGEG